MRLIAGLGNPDDNYQQNRHNVGFQFCDFLLKKLIDQSPYSQNSEIFFEQNKRFSSQIAQINLEKEKYLLAKPQTYMNASGIAIQKIQHYYQIAGNHCFVAHDELDIPLGKFKIQFSGGSKTHNGLKSIEQSLGNRAVWLIRIGIESRASESQITGQDFVLQNFTVDERNIVTKVFEDVYKRLLDRKLL